MKLISKTALAFAVVAALSFPVAFAAHNTMNDNLNHNTMNDNLPQETTKNYPTHNTMNENLHHNTMNENLHNHHHMSFVGPEGDVYGRCNPDGSVARGSEGMAYREHPMYGNYPFDTLHKLTNKTPQELYAEAYKSEVTAAGLAAKLGVFPAYKTERLAVHKSLMAKEVKAGKYTQAKADKMLQKLARRLDNHGSEYIMGKDFYNGMRYEHKTAPVVNKNA
jgi:hypothetical protein